MSHHARTWVESRLVIAIASGCVILGSLVALPSSMSFAADDDTLGVYGGDDIEEEGYEPIDQVAKTDSRDSLPHFLRPARPRMDLDLRHP